MRANRIPIAAVVLMSLVLHGASAHADLSCFTRWLRSETGESRRPSLAERARGLSISPGWRRTLSRFEETKGHLEQKRVLPALEEALLKRMSRAEGEVLPVQGGGENDSSHAKVWVASMQALARSAPQYGAKAPVPVSKTEYGASQGVYRVSLPQKRLGFFRPLATPRGAHITRLTRAAFKLNRMVGLQTVPAAEVAVVNGKVGILSEEAPGFAPVLGFALAKGMVDPVHLSNAQAFEFLVGNGDAHGGNLHIRAGRRLIRDGRIQVFDHDHAFGAGVVARESDRPLGATLPERYDPALLDQLRRLDRGRLFTQLGAELSPEEIEGVLLRRDVILEDARIRGERALFR